MAAAVEKSTRAPAGAGDGLAGASVSCMEILGMRTAWAGTAIGPFKAMDETESESIMTRATTVIGDQR